MRLQGKENGDSVIRDIIGQYDTRPSLVHEGSRQVPYRPVEAGLALIRRADMTNTPETQHPPPICPKCGDKRVGWSYTSEEERLECTLGDCGHLFEPPEHLKGKGPSKDEKQARRQELEIESSPPPSRERGDEFYWYINDVLVEALSFSGGYLPKPYIEWKDQHPTDSIKEWVEKEVDKFLNRKQMEEDWRTYKHSPERNLVLESVTSLQHCYTKILKDEIFPQALNSLRRRSADSLSRGLKKVLPTLWVPPKPENYHSLMTYAEAAEVLLVKKETVRKYKKRGELAGPKNRGFVTRDSVFAYLKALQEPE